MKQRRSEYGTKCCECGWGIPAGTLFNCEQEGIHEYIQCESCHESQLAHGREISSPAAVDEARAGLIPHDPLDDEPEPTCRACGSNLADDDDVEQEICETCAKVDGATVEGVCIIPAELERERALLSPEDSAKVGALPVGNVCPECGSTATTEPDDEGLIDCCGCGVWFKAVPPDPENMNDERAVWAEVAIVAFEHETGTDRGDAVADLLADLGHFCDRNGLDLQHELRRAASHYDEETEHKGTQFAGIAVN